MPPMTMKERAHEVLRCVEIFKTGCSNAGLFAKHQLGGSGDPADCFECTQAFLQRVERIVLCSGPDVAAEVTSDGG